VSTISVYCITSSRHVISSFFWFEWNQSYSWLDVGRGDYTGLVRSSYLGFCAYSGFVGLVCQYQVKQLALKNLPKRPLISRGDYLHNDQVASVLKFSCNLTSLCCLSVATFDIISTV